MSQCGGDVRAVPIGCVESAEPGPRWRRRSVLRIMPEYAPGLEDLEEYSHAFVIYYLHLIRWSGSLRARPRWAPRPLGVFATRSPDRPNALGLSVVALESVDPGSGLLVVRGLDADPGSPVLDVKPYDHWDSVPSPRVPRWWLERADEWPEWSVRPGPGRPRPSPPRPSSTWSLRPLPRTLS
ncbi:MAG: SAM-dependent methyltransferase [Conexivisphaera sp.]